MTKNETANHVIQPFLIPMSIISISIRPLAIGVALLCANASLGAAELTPLSISANHRYFEDKSGRPVFLVGDAPQNMPLKLAVSELEGYMAESALRGFNLL